MMLELFATTVLPVALTAGIIASVSASVVLVVTTLRGNLSRSAIVSRLSKIEAELKKDAYEIELQVNRNNIIDLERARDVMADLSVIAMDLQKRTEEAQSILNELRDSKHESGMGAAGRIADLNIGVGEAGSRVKNLLRRIETERQKLSKKHPTSAIGQG